MKTTLNTIPGCGRYHLHLTLGAKNSQGVYQMKIDQLLKGLHGFTAIHDDITVFGKDNDAHNQNLIAPMESAQVGLTFNSKKCLIRQLKILLFGVPAVGMKIHGILEMPPPTDLTQLQSFLGMVKAMCNFIPQLSLYIPPLWVILTKNAIFQWN